MSNPRIISGKARGFRLQPVPGNVTRPITDRVKEALFNIIGADVVESAWLDLFAGTGSVGIEALSRGAAHVCFIDKNRKAYETIRSNLEQTRLLEPSEVIFGDAFIAMKSSHLRPSDYIYVAPPQYKDIWSDALLAIDSRPDLINTDGWVIVQINPMEYRSVGLKNLEEFDQRKYGDSLLVFYRKSMD